MSFLRCALGLLVASLSFSLFAVNYFTWTGEGTPNADGSYNWTDGTNWKVGSVTPESGPSAEADAVTFPENMTVTVKLDFSGVKKFYYLDVWNANSDVTLVGSDGVGLDLPNFYLGNATGPVSLTLDGVHIGLNTHFGPISGTTLKLRNRAEIVANPGTKPNLNFTSSSSADYALDIELSGGSRIDISAGTGNINIGQNTRITLDDSTMKAYNIFFNNALSGGGAFVFKGTHPSLVAEGGTFRGDANTTRKLGTDFIFVVPEGGYAAAPIRVFSAIVVFDNNSVPAGTAHFLVDAASPALTAGTETRTEVIWSALYCARGKTSLNNANGTFGWYDRTGETAATGDTTAQTLWVTVGSGSPAEPPATEQSLFASAISATATHRGATVTAQAISLATATTTRMTLFCGTEKDKTACSATDVVQNATTLGAQTLDWTAPAGSFGDTYWFFVRVENLDSQGQVVATFDTGFVSATTLDTSVYTWVGGKTGTWSDSTCWSSDHAGDCVGAPVVGGSTAWFGRNCTVTLDGDYTTSILQLGATDLVLTLLGTDAESCRLTLDSSVKFTDRSQLILDGVYFKRVADNAPPTGGAIILRHQAIWQTNNFYDNAANSLVEITQGSEVRAAAMRFGSGARIVIDDATLTLTGDLQAGYSAKNGSILFKGKHPLLKVTSGCQFYSNLASANVTLDFEVPVGGFDEAPIKGAGSQSTAFYSDAKSAGNLMRILDSSPALRVDETIDQPLVSWPGTTGITIANVKFGEIETASKGSGFQYAAEAAEPYTWTAAASASGKPQTLGVHLVGSAHGDRITVSGNPAGFASSAEGWSPGYGDQDGYAVGEVTLRAPSEQVYDSEDTRGTVTGWKRYVVDPVTRERTFETAGAGATCTFAFDGAWREVEWQWALEYRVGVAVNDAAKGRVDKSTAWLAAGGSVTMTATSEEGYGFTRWTGDVDLSTCLDPTITVTADGVKNLCANFGKTYLVDGAYGNDATTDGTNPATPYKTINAALAQTAAFDKIVAVAGKYAEGKTWELNKAVVLSGVGSSQTIVSGCKIKMNCADAVLADLRVTGYGSSGAVEFVKAGAGGSIIRCDVSGNTRTSTDGTGIICYLGNIIDCTVTNNVNGSGGNGIGIVVLGGPTRIEGTLIADNDTGYGGTSGGLGISYTTTPAEWTKVSHCTIVRNRGGSTGGLYVSGNNQNVEIVDTIISDNLKYTDPTDANTPDCYLGWASNYRRILRNCIVGETPTHNGGYEISGCLENCAGGMLNAWEGDFRIGRNSAAWKTATDGTDIGWYQTAPAVGLDCGVWAEQNWGLVRVETTVHANVVNAPDGEVTYSWDFDNDGSFEIEGSGAEFAVRSHIFEKVGMNTVTLKVTVGEESVTRQVENVVYVAPPVTHVWTQSPNPTFPYATWETASHNPVDAVYTVPAGGRMQFTNEQVKIAKTIRVARAITVAGTGRENQSNNTKVVPSTGTLVQRTSGDVINFRIYNTGALIHSMAIGPGRPNVVCIYGNSCVSNCVIRNGEFTSGTAVGMDVSKGLVTHCVISNNATGGNSSGGGSVVLANGARLLNSYLTGALHTCTDGTGTRGTVYANDGCTVANCTIVGNTAGTGGGLYTTGKALVYNNIIRDNLAKVSNPDWYDATGTGVYVNNCMPTAHNEGDGTVSDEPAFLPGTITFEAGSPCANVGTNLDWMTEGMTDLFGNKRVSGGRVDIGCFEADSEKADCDIKAEPSSVVGAVPVTLTAIVTGVSLDGKTVAYDWYLGDAETPFASGESVTRTFAGGAHDIRLVVTVDGEVMFDKTKPSSVTVYSQDVYLATENPNAKFPYGTRETAATDFTVALEATPEGGTLHVMAGRHIVNKCITLSKEITIAADEGLSTRPTLLRTNKATDSGMFIRLGHEKALVTGLVIDDNEQYNQTVSIGSGTVSDCVISNAYYTSGTGIALDMSGGLCDRCEIVKCHGSNASDKAYGMEVTLTGDAVFRNSLVHKCSSRGTGLRPGLIYVAGSATMENCTIVSNTCSSYSVVYVGGKATVRNNIIWDNDYAVLPGKGGEGGPNWLILDGATPTLLNNCSPVALGANAVTDDPKFRVRKGKPYCLSAGSPCIGAGVAGSWMDEPGALDFYGNPRRFNNLPDIGCVESQVGGLMLLVK